MAALKTEEPERNGEDAEPQDDKAKLAEDGHADTSKGKKKKKKKSKAGE